MLKKSYFKSAVELLECRRLEGSNQKIKKRQQVFINLAALHTFK